jgi:hypothetical protein
MPALFVLIVFAGCVKDPFSTRQTENPYGSSGTWETPQSPEVTVRNLLYAYNEKIISNYQLCFSDSFMFSSPEDSIDAVNDGRADLFADWNYSVEIAVTNNIFLSYTSEDSADFFLTLAMTENYNDIIDDTLAVLYRDYNLILITGNIPADTAYFTGLATFHLFQEQLNWWTINYWADLPDVSGEDDWGDFKAMYR